MVVYCAYGHELSQALAACLENISAGSGAKAAFESPKVAAHGDLALAVLGAATILKREVDAKVHADLIGELAARI